MKKSSKKVEKSKKGTVPQAPSTSALGRSSSAAGRPAKNVLDVFCPYCQSKNFVKRGVRENKHQTVQLYLCKNPECGRTFTASDVKGKKFPLNIIIAGITLYNLGYTFEQCARALCFQRAGHPLHLKWRGSG